MIYSFGCFFMPFNGNAFREVLSKKLNINGGFYLKIK